VQDVPGQYYPDIELLQEVQIELLHIPVLQSEFKVQEKPLQ
jgi:hypothetical protein